MWSVDIGSLYFMSLYTLSLWPKLVHDLEIAVLEQQYISSIAGIQLFICPFFTYGATTGVHMCWDLRLPSEHRERVVNGKQPNFVDKEVSFICVVFHLWVSTGPGVKWVTGTGRFITLMAVTELPEGMLLQIILLFLPHNAPLPTTH